LFGKANLLKLNKNNISLSGDLSGVLRPSPEKLTAFLEIICAEKVQGVDININNNKTFNPDFDISILTSTMIFSPCLE
jgi:hypothetical protein